MNSNLCTTCGRPATNPTRRYGERGRVVEGCVDNFHTGQLVSCSESSFWHNRPAAKAIRRATVKRLKG